MIKNFFIAGVVLLASVCTVGCGGVENAASSSQVVIDENVTMKKKETFDKYLVKDYHDFKMEYDDHDVWVEDIITTEHKNGAYWDTSVYFVINLSDLSDDECQQFMKDRTLAGDGNRESITVVSDHGISRFLFADEALVELPDGSGKACVIRDDWVGHEESLDGVNATYTLDIETNIPVTHERSDGTKTEINKNNKYCFDMVFDITNGDLPKYIAAVAGPHDGVWRVRHFVDEFGDETDGVYLQNSDFEIGSFSNSATTNSECPVAFFVTKDSIAVRFIEYGSHIVKNSYSKPEYYDVIMKDSDGNVIKDLIATEAPGADQIILDEKNVQIVLDALQKDGTVSFKFINDDRPVEEYLFTVDTSGFKKLYENTFGS